MEQPPNGSEERNALILRRTLSTVSWLYALWSGLIGATAWGRTTLGPYDPQLLVLHAGVLGAAGAMLWKPRRGAAVALFAAAAGSIFFVVLDVRRHNVQSAIVDGAYVALAIALWIKSRRHP